MIRDIRTNNLPGDTEGSESNLLGAQPMPLRPPIKFVLLLKTLREEFSDYGGCRLISALAQGEIKMYEPLLPRCVSSRAPPLRLNNRSSYKRSQGHEACQYCMLEADSVRYGSPSSAGCLT